MAKQINALVALAKDLGPVPGSHTVAPHSILLTSMGIWHTRGTHQYLQTKHTNTRTHSHTYVPQQKEKSHGS